MKRDHVCFWKTRTFACYTLCLFNFGNELVFCSNRASDPSSTEILIEQKIMTQNEIDSGNNWRYRADILLINLFHVISFTILQSQGYCYICIIYINLTGQVCLKNSVNEVTFS